MSKQIRNVLVGIDFSDSSGIVLRHGLHLGETMGVKVTALHVVDKSGQEYREASGLKSPGIGRIEEKAKERFAKLAGDAVAHVEFLVSVGKPADELAKVAEERGADLLVVSANDLTKKRLGSVASRCVRMAPCDVLILRDWQGGDFKKIVVCTDFSKTADAALAVAAGLARQDAAELEIVHVIYPPGRDSWGEVLEHAADAEVSYEDECRAAVDRKMQDCLGRHSVALAGVKYKAMILESEMPSVIITGHVISSGADLVVMGTRGHSPVASYFLGTNAEKLLQDSPVSVYAVR